jgi:uncharacterized protein (DUF2141 family)
MSNVRFPLILAALAASVAAATSAHAAVLGKDAAACEEGKPAILVRISGFKKPTGEVKVSLFSDDSSRFLVKGGNIRKVFAPVRSKSPLDVCVAVPRPGRYSVAVHHDINGNGDMDAKDGGGFSRNPKLTIFNRKPPLAKTVISVGNAPAQAGVRLLYVKGLALAPASS